MNSGTKDENGNWIPETPQAKLRNKLSPFWVLTDMLSLTDDDKLKSKKSKDLLKSLVETCQENKASILELINETENN